MDKLINFMGSRFFLFLILLILLFQAVLFTGCIKENKGAFNMGNESYKIPDKKNRMETDIKNNFSTLFVEWQMYINQPNVKISSKSEDYITCQPYRDIVSLGKSVLPFVIEKLKEGKLSGWNKGEFFLWYAVRDISEVDLSKDLKKGITSEQDIADAYIFWWANNNK